MLKKPIQKVVLYRQKMILIFYQLMPLAIGINIEQKSSILSLTYCRFLYDGTDEFGMASFFKLYTQTDRGFVW